MVKQFAKQLLLSALFIPVLFSCKKDQNNPIPPVTPNTVRLSSNAKLGNILTDSAGKTLYFFSLDASGQSFCAGGCLVAWPVFYAGKLTLDKGLDSSDFSTIARADGKSQTTYKGWPLYYYESDSLAGDTKGDPVGNVWFVAKPDYTVMLAKGQLVGKDGVSYDSTYHANTAKSTYLTDDYGRTLYSFDVDKFKVNNYTKSDFSNNAYWPIFGVTAIQSVPSILDKSLLDNITVFGRTQLTFKGWPMYWFGSDSLRRGNTRGVSVPQPGVWPVVDQYSPTAPQ